VQRTGREQDRPRQGRLLHTRGQVGRLPHRRVVHPQVAADRPHDHLARVQTDANLYPDAARAKNLVGVLPGAVLHAERGVAGADGVVLVG